MPLVEGIGDEVLAVFIVFCIVIVLALAWLSTSINETNWRTISVIIGHVELRRNQNANSSTNDSTVTQQESNTETPGDKCTAGNSSGTTQDAQSTDSDVGTLSSSASEIIKDGDKKDCPVSSSEIRAEKCDLVGSEPSCDDGNTANIVTEQLTPEETEPSITVKLKFLNDTQRLVNGKLQEELGEFRRRHFETELSTNKLVRLIFNGQLLRSDNDTLEHHGLFHNCVVHCHISNTPQQQSPTASTPQPEDELDLDLGHYMLPLFCVLLVILWYCWFQFGHFFNTVSTVGLVGITGLLIVSFVAVYTPLPGDRQRLNHPIR